MSQRSLPSRLLRLAGAVASGILLALAMPPDGIESFVWFWAVPLFVALWSLPGRPARDEEPPSSGRREATRPLPGRFAIPAGSRTLRGAGLGFAAGLTFFLINLRWLIELRHVIDSLVFAVIGLLALASYLALFFAAWGAFVATVGRPSTRELSARGDTGLDKRSAPPMPGPRNPVTRQWSPGRTGFTAGLFGSSLASLRFALLNASAWTALEWIRGWLLTGFGWNGLTVALHANPTLVQIADVVGATGLSFLPVFVTAILLHTVWRIHLEAGSRRLRPHLDFMVAVTMVIGVFFYGVDRASAPPAGDAVEVRTLLVQPNIPQSLKWDPEAAIDIYRTLDDLTRLNVEIHPFDLVVWPEASLPLHLDHPEHRPYLESLLALGDHSLLLGANVLEPRGVQPSEDEPRGVYNSGALLRESVAEARVHHKIHLVPFGEFLPLRRVFPPFEKVFGALLPSDFDRGTSTEPLVLELPGGDGRPPVLVSPLICFEDTVPRVVRRLVRPGAPQVLVNLTNDAWFGESRASHQHLANASLRCIEFRRPMIRCANNGVSCIIDPTGSHYDRETGDGFRRVIEDPDTGNTFIRGTLPATLKIDPDPPTTVYARIGDAFSILCAVIAASAALIALRSGRPGARPGDASREDEPTGRRAGG